MASNFSLLEAIRLDILPSHFFLDLGDLLSFPVWRRLPLPLSRWGWGSNVPPLDFFQAANYFFFEGEIRSYSGFRWYRRSTTVLLPFPLLIAPVRPSSVATSVWVTRLFFALYFFTTGHVGNRKSTVFSKSLRLLSHLDEYWQVQQGHLDPCTWSRSSNMSPGNFN